MLAYAIAIINETRFGPEIKEYLEKIDSTLTSYLGSFKIHGGPYEIVEGNWSSDLIVIEFPDLSKAKEWYNSSDYQNIKHLRVNNTDSVIFLVEGTPDNHKAIDILG